MKPLSLKSLCLLCISLISLCELHATGEASTYFQVFVPPNAVSSSRSPALIVTAIHDSTSFQIIDDDMDGDSDDSYSGTLQAGQSYVLYIKDNAVNDDRTGKKDGDYFIITSSNLVVVSQSTDSDWQHDWVPATNKSSKGQKFYIYAPEISSSKRDLNVYAYEDSTTVTISKISAAPITSTGYTVLDTQVTIVAQRLINIGEDLIYFYQDGRDIMETGETYLVEANRPITVQYGALHRNARDGGGYVPSDNGSSSGELFYFTVHTQASKEQEIRIVSWDSANVVTLDYFNNGTWTNIQNWSLDNLDPGDWVSTSGNIDKVFRVTCTKGKQVSVFEANWLETGSPGTSDIASMVSSRDGTTSGDAFLVYMAPPGNEPGVWNPFDSTTFTKATHAYIFAKDSANVTVKDANTDGAVINRTYHIGAGRYADCFLDLSEWQSIYNGDGNPNSGPERPYLVFTSDAPIAILNTNFNDNWMNYFGTSKPQDFKLIGGVVPGTPENADTSVQLIGGCFEMGDTAFITTDIVFNNFNYPLTNPTIEIVVPDGVVVFNSKLKNTTINTTYIGTSTINSQGKTVITFPNLPSLASVHTYQLETQLVLGVNRYDGTKMDNETLFTVETTLSGDFQGEFQQASVANGILICLDAAFPEAVVINSENSWSVAWGDYDNDCDPDLFITNYDTDESNAVFTNNGDGTFSELAVPPIGTDKASSTGASWADYDNDGDLDLFVGNNIGFRNYLYRNDGANWVSVQNDPIVNDNGYAHGVAWADYDNDGHLDMATVEFFPTRFNNLYHSNGDGTFSKQTTGDFILEAAFSVGVAWADYDNDGDQDIFVANTNNSDNSLYQNVGNGNFVRVNSLVSADGGSSVGASWGDYDNDGDEDLFVANAAKQNNFLYQNNGDGTFTKITNSPIALDGGDSHGSGWVDMDNDGDLDLFVANDQGAVNFVYLNNGDGTFDKLDHRLSLFSSAGGNSFGSAWADYDLDGDMDLFIANHQDQANILIPNIHGDRSKYNFMHFKLAGTNSNASAIGAKIAIKATINGQSYWQYRTVSGQTGGGIGGQSDLKVHFGLGNATTIDSVVIQWPSGYRQVETNIAANQTCYTITETPGSDVSGTVYYDENQNCVQDAGEAGIAGVNLQITPGNIQVTTDADGFYSVNLGVGDYSIKQFTGGNWSQYCPGLDSSQAVTVSQIGITYPNNNFGDTAACKLPDLSLQLSTTALRVGFESLYAINYKNEGTVAATNTVLTVDFGQHIIPQSASIPWSSVNGTVYTWDLGTVDFKENVTIYVEDSVRTTATIGNNLSVTATITADDDDCFEGDNVVVDVNEAVGAIDPNDITVYPNEGGIKHDQELTYRIRFQNVGNDLVNRVIVRNTLPEHLDIDELVLGTASHAYRFYIEDERTLVWDFENINLPDSASDMEGSNGAIFYKILPKKDLESGALIENTAAIFFDASEPVITNTVVNFINGTPSTPVGEIEAWPNPASDIINLKIATASNTEVINVVEIYDVMGHLVLSQLSVGNKQTVIENGKTLPNGVYFVKIIGSEGNEYVGKVVVRN